MQRVGFGVHLVAVRLAGLRQQDEWRGIGRLETEREVQQDEGIEIEVRDTYHVQHDPDRDDDRLGDQEERRPKEAGEDLGFDAEPVAAEDWGEVSVRGVEAEVVPRYGMRLGSVRQWCCGYCHDCSFADG